MSNGLASHRAVLLASFFLGACGRTALLSEPAVRDCTGIDLQADNQNCGACGNPCSAIPPSTAACMDGRCRVTLATDQGGILAIAVDDEAVYWTSTDAVMKISKMGGKPVTVVGGQSGGPSSIALDGANLYWINRTGGPPDPSGGLSSVIMKAPKSGSPAVQLATDLPWLDSDIAVDTTSVYWTTNPSLDYPSGSVMKIAIGGGAPIALATYQYDPTGIAVDATSAYWTTEDYGLMKVPVAGGTPVHIGSAGPGAIVLRNGFAYSFSGEYVVKIPVDGGDSSILAKSPGNGLPIGIAVDDTSVYWTEGEWILKVATDGGPLDRLVWRQQGPNGIAVDDTSVYWTNWASGTVMKLSPK